MFSTTLRVACTVVIICCPEFLVAQTTRSTTTVRPPNATQSAANITKAKLRKEADKQRVDYAEMAICFIFGGVVINSIARHAVSYFHVTVPYTVFIFALGFLISWSSKKFILAGKFAYTTYMTARLLRNLVIAPLIFESVFSMDAHMFTKSLYQCMLLSIIGLGLFGGLLVGFSITGLSIYNWAYSRTFLYAISLGATDPMVASSLLKECGISPILCTLIKGESFLNQAFTLFLHQTVLSYIQEEKPVTEKLQELARMFVESPIIGYVGAKFAEFWLSYIYRDELLEFTITLTVAYLTYFAAEKLHLSSGVLAIVVFGVQTSLRKAIFSPETEESLGNYWEIMSFIATTVVYAIGGKTFETTIHLLQWKDVGLGVCSFVFSTIFRFVVIAFLSPMLARTGYGLAWRDVFGLTWGGIRGAISVLMAVTLHDYIFDEKDNMIPGHDEKLILFHICVCIFLSGLINGSTLRLVLDALGMNDMSQSQKIAMGNALIKLRETAIKSIKIHKRDKFLSDANWLWVSSHTHIQGSEKSDQFDQSCAYTPFREMRCPKCDNVSVVQPTLSEKVEMEEEGRLRVLKSLKSIYWNHFEQCIITRETVHILTLGANDAIDVPGTYLSARNLRQKYMNIPLIVETVMRVLTKFYNKIKVHGISDERKYIAAVLPYTEGLKQYCMRIYMKPYFDIVILFTTVLNIVPIVLMGIDFTGDNTTNIIQTIVLIIIPIFFLIYVLECFFKVMALGYSLYIKRKWNKVSLMLIFTDIITIIVEIYSHYKPTEIAYYFTLVSRLLRLIRVFEMYTLALELMGKFVLYMQEKIAAILYSSYDLGFAFVIAQEEVLEKIDFMKGYQSCGSEPIIVTETNILEMLQAMSDIQSKHAGVTAALMSHKACQKIFNDVRTTLIELRQIGQVDETEYAELFAEIDERVQAISNATKSLLISKNPKDMISKIDWLHDDSKLLNSVVQNYVKKSYSVHQTIDEIGESPNSISIILTGVVKITGSPVPKADQLPNVHSAEYFKNEGRFFDYISSLQCLGALGYLVNTPFVTSARCETPVQVLEIGNPLLRSMERICVGKTPLTYFLWRHFALKMALPILKEQPRFQNIKPARLKVELQKSVLPDLSRSTRYDVPARVRAIMLIQGKVRDHFSGTVYIGPTYIPSSSRQLTFDADLARRSRVVILLLPDSQFEQPEDLEWSMAVTGGEDKAETVVGTDRIVDIDTAGEINRPAPRTDNRRGPTAKGKRRGQK